MVVMWSPFRSRSVLVAVVMSCGDDVNGLALPVCWFAVASLGLVDGIETIADGFPFATFSPRVLVILTSIAQGVTR